MTIRSCALVRHSNIESISRHYKHCVRSELIRELRREKKEKIPFVLIVCCSKLHSAADKILSFLYCCRHKKHANTQTRQNDIIRARGYYTHTRLLLHQKDTRNTNRTSYS